MIEETGAGQSQPPLSFNVEVRGIHICGPTIADSRAPGGACPQATRPPRQKANPGGRSPRSPRRQAGMPHDFFRSMYDHITRSFGPPTIGRFAPTVTPSFPASLAVTRGNAQNGGLRRSRRSRALGEGAISYHPRLARSAVHIP